MPKTWTRNDLIEKIHSKVGVSLTESSKLIEDISTDLHDKQKVRRIAELTEAGKSLHLTVQSAKLALEQLESKSQK